MNQRILPRLRLSAVLLLLVSLTAGTAWAQNYAKPNGTTVYTTDGDCGTPAARINPCSLSDAVQDATDGNASGNGSTVFVALPNIGATVTFQEDLMGAAEIDADATFDTFFGATDGGFAGFIALDGDIVVDGGATMTIVEDVEVRIVGQPGRLELHDTAVIDGDGFIAFTTAGGEHLILLGEPAIGCATPPTPNTAHVRNMRIDRPSGEVMVRDECATDDESDLFITNRLQLDDGTLEMNDNNLRIVSLSEASGGDNPGVEFASQTSSLSPSATAPSPSPIRSVSAANSTSRPSGSRMLHRTASGETSASARTASICSTLARPTAPSASKGRRRTPMPRSVMKTQTSSAT